MPSSNSPTFGNLQNYKLYLRPNAHAHYGSFEIDRKRMTKHQQNVQSLLKLMSKNGPKTTWELAKISIPNDISKLREREKIYRRLLVGRKDKGKFSGGILESGLAVRDGKSLKTGTSDKYRLSLYGVLYCIDALNISDKEIDEIAAKYSKTLPKVFGKWGSIKSVAGDRTYGIRLLAQGLLADNPQIQVHPGIPFYELMSFVHIKYQRDFEKIEESQLAEQISYWFYVNLLYQPPQKKEINDTGIKKLEPIFEAEPELKRWFLVFFRESKKYFYQRYSILRKSDRK